MAAWRLASMARRTGARAATVLHSREAEARLGEAGHRQALYVTYIAARGTNFLASKRHRQKAITQVFLFALVIFRDSIQFTFSILIFLFSRKKHTHIKY